MVNRLPAMWETWLKKILQRRKWQTTPGLLAGKFHGWRSLVGYSPWGRKESDMTESLHFTSLLHFDKTSHPILHLTTEILTVFLVSSLRPQTDSCSQGLERQRVKIGTGHDAIGIIWTRKPSRTGGGWGDRAFPVTFWINFSLLFSVSSYNCLKQ